MTAAQRGQLGIDADQLRVAAALADESRHQLYALICDAGEPVTREQAADVVGISRKLAAFHLDKLVEAGLLVADYDPASRAHRLGRAPKAYRPADVDVHILIPDRRPEALARVLIDAITSARPDESPIEAARRAAREAGHRLASAARAGLRRSGRLSPERALAAAERVLRDQGYQPVRESPGTMQLLNCPFRPLNAEATEFVCGLNQQLLSGLLEGLDATARAELVPQPGKCCVVVSG